MLIEHDIGRCSYPTAIDAALLRVAQNQELCQRRGEAAHKMSAVKTIGLDYGERLLAKNAYWLDAEKVISFHS
jgi:hypothetical protein